MLDEMTQPALAPSNVQRKVSHPSRNHIESLRSQANSLTENCSKAGCQCPQAIVNLLEDSENKSHEVKIGTIDMILAYEKSALKRCKVVLDCELCNSPSDHMMLVAVVCRKLVSLMEEVVRILTEQKRSRPNVGNECGSHVESWKISFGEYPIDSEAEWMPIMITLTVVLLKETMNTLHRLKRIARTSLRETQVAILQAIEHKAANMALIIQRSEGEHRRNSLS